MKRLIALFALASLLVLSACGGGSGSSGKSSYSTDLPQKVMDAGAFSEPLDEVDGDTAFMLYHLGDAGLDREELADCKVLRSSGATCEEAAVLIFKWADGDKSSEVKSALDSYVQAQIEANQNYRPDDIPKLENAIVEQQGDSFLLIVANDAEAAKGAIS